MSDPEPVGLTTWEAGKAMWDLMWLTFSGCLYDDCVPCQAEHDHCCPWEVTKKRTEGRQGYGKKYWNSSKWFGPNSALALTMM